MAHFTSIVILQCIAFSWTCISYSSKHVVDYHWYITIVSLRKYIYALKPDIFIYCMNYLFRDITYLLVWHCTFPYRTGHWYPLHGLTKLNCLLFIVYMADMQLRSTRPTWLGQILQITDNVSLRIPVMCIPLFMTIYIKIYLIHLLI